MEAEGSSLCPLVPTILAYPEALNPNHIITL
jgi:hypothetical protein